VQYALVLQDRGFPVVGRLDVLNRSDRALDEAARLERGRRVPARRRVAEEVEDLLLLVVAQVGERLDLARGRRRRACG